MTLTSISFRTHRGRAGLKARALFRTVTSSQLPRYVQKFSANPTVPISSAARCLGLRQSLVGSAVRLFVFFHQVPEYHSSSSALTTRSSSSSCSQPAKWAIPVPPCAHPELQPSRHKVIHPSFGSPFPQPRANTLNQPWWLALCLEYIAHRVLSLHFTSELTPCPLHPACVFFPPATPELLLSRDHSAHNSTLHTTQHGTPQAGELARIPHLRCQWPLC